MLSICGGGEWGRWQSGGGDEDGFTNGVRVGVRG